MPGVSPQTSPLGATQTICLHLTVPTIATNTRRTVASGTLPSPAVIASIDVFHDSNVTGVLQGAFDILIADDADAINDVIPTGVSLFALTPNPIPGPGWPEQPELPLFVVAGASVALYPRTPVMTTGVHLKLSGRRNAVGSTNFTLVAVLELLDGDPNAPWPLVVPRGTAPPPICVQVCDANGNPVTFPPGAPTAPGGRPATPAAAGPSEAERRPARLDPIGEPLPDPCGIDTEYPLETTIDACSVQ